MSATELYSTLGLDPTCSEDDIKRAYRRLSRTYHPDRRLDMDEKRAAAPHWLRISAAYDILADDRKRMVYDELGGQHLQEGLALLRTRQGQSVATAEELHREWRRAQSKGADAHSIGRMGVSGSVVVSVSVAEVLQPSDPSVPLMRRLVPEVRSVLERAIHRRDLGRVAPRVRATLGVESRARSSLPLR